MSSNDAWARLDAAFVEHATVSVMIEEHGGDWESGDENRVAVRLSHGSVGVGLYGTPEELAAFGRRLTERYS